MRIWDFVDTRWVLLGLAASLMFGTVDAINGDLPDLFTQVLFGLWDLYILKKHDEGSK
ncbi:hypothetical protein JI721_11950 [Alicyclobacillus cycloheptanicus]|uniref:Holin n=1 Tax=Alicyclobacillus cycloheptanicus TaxID=1457 RepID=A0ABT9XG35_9BACL|nr:hypothetical protein [Alicyclobacillus cycloheptanicus]MDQ0189249.1 hypothetical protein [Alicyclobacillus cycloheptanicus]WDM00432.1 hypothetical protein JI721_11950 [Alicyclobacillus cycloheptanicus]